ncbi:MAG: GH92 family glycosyl hydrolase [Massilibacteroides sp.]|nr:GH92 family glycosyl hydrolase [Massilibacteroides sp.]MDD3062569.1 GH92 family glycosyl hydrolase [Massilibacteroides sp.]MDD4115542.1 GH92 family glycosyl hydrolase [Massilibacteroides sp.]MDD4659339.1 GH92 family glycosyl hydrolase [Massilibacteroides sp.]
MNLMKKTFAGSVSLGLFTCLALGGFSCQQSVTEKAIPDFTQYVDPYIGTGDHGHVFLGANVPFGAVQLGPSNITQGWDWCSGYHITDSTIMGFAHTHLSGTGIGDLGDIVFMPLTGEPLLKRGIAGDSSTGFYSLFRRETEKVKPGYYAVHLDRYDVDVELTATARVGFHKYTYQLASAADPKLVIDLAAGIGWDSPQEGHLVQENDTVISGYRYSKGWANDQRIYFTAVFSEPITNFAVYDTTALQEGKELTTRQVYGVAQFAAADKAKEVYAKVAISPVSVAGAKANLSAELPGWNFGATIAAAGQAWNEELSKIQITSNDMSVKRNFYTALYHTMTAPSVFSDVDGSYWGTDKTVHSGEGFKNYTTFSLWDTYRAAHPLMTIIHPEKVPDIIQTMLHIYQQQGKLPVWHLMANETNCMVGNPGISVVADAYLKGFGGFDKNLAYEAMKASAMLDERGLNYFKQLGYIPFDKENESVAKGLEYALADWALAQVAKERGETADYDYFLKRSNSFTYYFDKSINFVRGVDLQGDFRPEPLDPFKSVHRINDYTEGNAWQYTWLVPQNIKGLVDLFGSEAKFVGKLDSLFIVQGDLGDEASPDISGLIGQYAHGNEPSHHIIYMYSYVGQPWKTADKVREVMTTLYRDAPAGLCGNEDVGQMSAWYVLSALGLYQVAPAGGVYVFGSPLIDEAVIRVGSGKTFTVRANNNSPENRYIQQAMLNGEPYSKSYIDYKAIQAGGELVFEMGSTPSPTFGVAPENRPQTIQ